MAATSSPATAVRYRDVAAAMEWLCTAFGFEKQTVVAGENGAIDYAQLTCGHAMLMLAPVRDTPLAKFMKQPDEIGGAATQSTYLVVDDADAHHARAKAAGAEIVLELQDDDFGGRGYSCRDPEGHVWMFGTYDPWQGKGPEAPELAPPPVRSGRRPVMLAGLGVAALAALAAAVWTVAAPRQPVAVSSAALHEPAGAAKGVAEADTGGATAAEAAIREAHLLLEKERAARLAADRAGGEALKRAAEERSAREAAERSARELRIDLEHERAAKVDAEKVVAGKAGEEALKRIAEERSAREAAERSAREARAELERERAARPAAEKAAAARAGGEALKRVAEERRAREAAERSAREARAELERERATKAAAEKSGAGVQERVAAAEKAAKEARAQVERAHATSTAAEMAKEFALTRADEERLGREAAERALEEVRAELERERLAKASPQPADQVALKRAAELEASVAQLKKNTAEAERARQAAEETAEEAREQLARERAAKASAWRVVSQLTRQLKQLQAKSAGGPPSAGSGEDAAQPAKKARPRPRTKAKKAPDPDE
jgi:uncharacterized glyoxalase superfamily protein PhnB